MAISFGSRAFMVALLAAMLFWNPLTAFAQSSADADVAIVRDLAARGASRQSTKSGFHPKGKLMSHGAASLTHDPYRR